MDTMSDSPDVTTGATDADQEAKRDFTSHVVDYVAINAFLIGVWALSGGYFWPAWVIAVWGAGLAVHAWQTFVHRPITELDVDADLSRHH